MQHGFIVDYNKTAGKETDALSACTVPQSGAATSFHLPGQILLPETGIHLDLIPYPNKFNLQWPSPPKNQGCHGTKVFPEYAHHQNYS